MRDLTGSDVGWGYTRQRITGGAEEWRDGLAVGGVAFCSEAHEVAPLDAEDGSRRSRQCWRKKTGD